MTMIAPPKGIPPQKFRAGKLTVKRLNVFADRIEAMAAGVGGPSASPGAALASVTQQFEIHDVQDNYLNCFVVTTSATGETVGTVDVRVAKPYLLRNSLLTRTFDALVHTYTYNNVQERVDTQGATTEIQVVTPRYAGGDRVFAERGIGGGTGVRYTDPLTQVATLVRWIDKNQDGRAWAKKS